MLKTWCHENRSRIEIDYGGLASAGNYGNMKRLWKDDLLAMFPELNRRRETATPPSPPRELLENPSFVGIDYSSDYVHEKVNEALEKAAQELEAKANILLTLVGLPVCPSPIIQRDRADQWNRAAEVVRALMPKEEGKS